MHPSDDMQLLREYASEHSEAAFTALVTRHINLVYSAALRSVNNPHQAEEIAQAVFVTLARKSGALRRGTALSGWLYQTARLTACNFIRSETRRRQREQQARIQSDLNEPAPETWTGVGPLLDEAMAQLNERDRDAVVLRYFEGKPLKDVGEALGASEDAAKMRVSRALDKLRDFFHRRGITMPAAALAAAISENSSQSAPAGLAASVAAGAVGGSALAGPTLTVVKGAIEIMTSTKIGVVIGACAAAAIIALQAHQVSIQKQTVKQLQEQAAQDAQVSRAQEARIAKLQEQNAFNAKSKESSARDVATARARVSAALAAKQTATAAAARKGNPMAEMFKDPDMLKAMRPQQLYTTKLMYAPLVKRLDLSPEQADKFYNIIVDYGLKSVEAMHSGKLNADEIKSNTQSMEADLQSLLGNGGFARYQDFTKNDMAVQGEWTVMKSDFVNNPLSDTQQQQLLQAMKTARQSVTANSPLDLSSANPSDKLALMGQVLQQQEQINQNVLQQAAAFLTPDQLQTLGASQSNMMAMQKSMGPMMQKMFSNAPGGP